MAAAGAERLLSPVGRTEGGYGVPENLGSSLGSLHSLGGGVKLLFLDSSDPLCVQKVKSQRKAIKRESSFWPGSFTLKLEYLQRDGNWTSRLPCGEIPNIV